MSSLDFDIDSQMTRLEREWRHAFETSVLASADFEALRSTPNADRVRMRRAVDALERADAAKARVMRKIEKLEDSLRDS